MKITFKKTDFLSKMWKLFGLLVTSIVFLTFLALTLTQLRVAYDSLGIYSLTCARCAQQYNYNLTFTNAIWIEGWQTVQQGYLQFTALLITTVFIGVIMLIQGASFIEFRKDKKEGE